MIKAIVIDFGGVLTCSPNFSAFASRYAKAYGLDQKHLQERISSAWDRTKTGQRPSAEFWQELALLAKADMAIVRNNIIESDGFRPEIVPLLAKLKHRFRLAMLTNQIKDWLDQILTDKGLYPLFDVILTSYDYGMAKPSREFYLEVTRELKVRPEECIFIDDSPNNLPPASALGMQTILFRDVSQLTLELEAKGLLNGL